MCNEGRGFRRSFRLIDTSILGSFGSPGDGTASPMKSTLLSLVSLPSGRLPMLYPVRSSVGIPSPVNSAVVKSARNIPKVKVVLGNMISTYDIIWADKIILTESALTLMEEVFKND